MKRPIVISRYRILLEIKLSQMKIFVLVVIFNLFFVALYAQQDGVWIRINQLGYYPGASKVAVAGVKGATVIKNFELVDAATSETVFRRSAGKNFGKYGPFDHSYRLDFSSYKTAGTYYLKTANG